MGYYINQMPNGDLLPTIGKAEKLLTLEGVKKIPPPKEFEEDLVCVVDNIRFEAAAYAYSEAEMDEFLRPDGRDKIWLKVPNAKELAK